MLMIGITLMFTNCKKEGNNSSSNGTMTDQDGNVYKTVTIGIQIWMAENLRTTKYNDGTAIPNVTSNISWISLTSGAYCNYNNTTNTDTITTYGRLYNWQAVNTGKLAPKGWHVPNDNDWKSLIAYLGGDSVADRKLKEIGTLHWISPNDSTTNESGFTALPGGQRGPEGIFFFIGHSGKWWSNTIALIGGASFGINGDNFLDYFNIEGPIYKNEPGYSVRCLRD